MKPNSHYTVLLLGLFLSAQGIAQNVLPEFSVKELAKGKIQVSWNNPFPNCIQLAIQRSTDSSRNFRTIFSTQSPELPSNGFVDIRFQAGIKLYYRIFYVLSGGDYYFSKIHSVTTFLPAPIAETPFNKPGPPAATTENPKEKKIAAENKNNYDIGVFIKKYEVFKFTKGGYKRFRDSINTKTKDALHKINDHAIEWRPAKPKNKKDLISVYQQDAPTRAFTKKGYQRFKDSIYSKTKDSLFRIDESHVQVHPFVPKEKKYISIYTNNLLVMQVEPSSYQRFRDSVANGTKDTIFMVTNSRSDIHPFFPKIKTFISIYKNDSLIIKVEAAYYKKFKDSLAFRTKDTLFVTDNNRADIHPFIPKYVWVPSIYVYTNLQGYVSISLPLVKQHKYQILFFDEDGSELFRIKTIKETELILDKTNFIHAGWFSFQLFEDDKLKEKNKFLLQKD